jgi:hypothetical protein
MLAVYLGGRSFVTILIEFGIPMKLLKIRRVLLNETYVRVYVGKDLLHRFPSKNGLKVDVLLPLLFKCALEYAIRRVQAIMEGLMLNDTHQLLVYAGDVDILGGRMQIIKKNTEALVVASKEIDLEVNAEETKYMVICRIACRRRSQDSSR